MMNLRDLRDQARLKWQKYRPPDEHLPYAHRLLLVQLYIKQALFVIIHQ